MKHLLGARCCVKCPVTLVDPAERRQRKWRVAKEPEEGSPTTTEGAGWEVVQWVWEECSRQGARRLRVEHRGTSERAEV